MDGGPKQTESPTDVKERRELSWLDVWRPLVGPLRRLQLGTGGLVSGSVVLQFLERGVGAGVRFRTRRKQLEAVREIFDVYESPTRDCQRLGVTIARHLRRCILETKDAPDRHISDLLSRLAGIRDLNGVYSPESHQRLFLTVDNVASLDVDQWTFASNDAIHNALGFRAHELLENAMQRHWNFKDVDFLLAATVDNVAAFGRFLKAIPKPRALIYRDSLDVLTVFGEANAWAILPEVDTEEVAGGGSGGDVDVGELFGPACDGDDDQSAAPRSYKRARVGLPCSESKCTDAVTQQGEEGRQGEDGHSAFRQGEDERPNGLSDVEKDFAAAAKGVEKDFAAAMKALLTGLGATSAQEKYSAPTHGPTFLVRLEFEEAAAESTHSSDTYRAAADFVFVPCKRGEEWPWIVQNFDLDICANAVGVRRILSHAPDNIVTRRPVFRDSTYCRVFLHAPASETAPQATLRGGANHKNLEHCSCGAVMDQRWHHYRMRGYAVRTA